VFPVPTAPPPPPAEIRVAGDEPAHPAGAQPWLPVLPPAHTYRATPAFASEPPAPPEAAAEEARRRRRVAESVARLDAAAAAAAGAAGSAMADPTAWPGAAAVALVPALVAQPSTAPAAGTAGALLLLPQDLGDFDATEWPEPPPLAETAEEARGLGARTVLPGDAEAADGEAAAS
jgi:hypothetical protein